jgi:hypothetical protein
MFGIVLRCRALGWLLSETVGYGIESGFELWKSTDMNSALKEIVKRAENWSEHDQMELVKAALFIEQKHNQDFQLNGDDWKIIDARKQAAELSGLASDAEVAALFNKYRAA